MRTEQQAFKVSFVGFDERERRILRSVMALSTTRPRSYSFRELAAEPSDLYLVDGENANAVATWHGFAQQHGLSGNKAAYVAQKDLPSFGKWRLQRPIIPSRLFSLLDDMTIETLHFLPELHIGAASPKVPVEAVPGNGPATVAPMTVAPMTVAPMTVAPLSVAPATIAPASVMPPEFRTNKHTVGHALVVDDSPTVRKQIELGLRLRQISVDFAETGEQALERIENCNYDIIFLDIMLPGLDGYQVCRRIKKDRRYRSTPVVMLTGKSSMFDRVKGSMAGCDTYLTKPVENALFQRVVNQHLAHRLETPGLVPAT